MDEYNKQAQAFLDTFGVKLKVDMRNDKCPPWNHTGGCQHGDHYRVTLRKADKRSLSFDFWGSIVDMQNHKDPTAYAVLTCLGIDVQAPTDPDEVAEEFGDMKPSEAIAIAKFARRLQRFFSEEEVQELSEIQ